MKKLNNKGFTLVELLTVILILLVILAVAMPSITSAIKRTETKRLNSVKSAIASTASIQLSRGDFNNVAPETTGYNAFKNATCFIHTNTNKNDTVPNDKLKKKIGKDVYNDETINIWIGYTKKNGDITYAASKPSGKNECALS